MQSRDPSIQCESLPAPDSPGTRMIEKLSFNRKILLLMVTAVVGVLLVSGLAFMQLREEIRRVLLC